MIQKQIPGIFLSCIFILILISCSKENSSEDKPTVYIEKEKGQYQLIRNGEPFFIKGGAAHSDYLEELKEAGANTARIYDTTNLKQTLDKAHELGLAVAVDLPMPRFNNHPEYYEDQDLFEIMYQKIRETVVNHKDHPALLYWNLGNELYYPYFYRITKFHSNFNSLIDLIHDLDPNHPVSTTTIGANKLLVVSITLLSPQLDFISFNSFGTLSSFSRRLKPIAPVWTGPYVISEWGVNGPWEAQLTSWQVPIEETSTKKAEQIMQRHQKYISPLKERNLLGSFVFYWGKKNEFTPTWYSIFGEDGLKTQSAFDLENLWKGTDKTFPGPEISYILLNEEGAAKNLILDPLSIATAEVVIPKSKQGNINYHWEIRPESWYDRHSSEVLDREFRGNGQQVRFSVPEEEGPYRLFTYLTNNTGYYATANIPFYVLNPGNEK